MSFLLDPDAVLDFAFDWSKWLSTGETITAQDVTVSPGAAKGLVTQANGIVTVWLSQGVPGATVTMTCHITTSDSRQDDRSMIVTVKDR